MKRIFLVLMFIATCTFKYLSCYFIFYVIFLIFIDLLITFILVLSGVMVINSSLNSLLSIVYFNVISNCLSYCLLCCNQDWYYFPLACPFDISSVYLYDKWKYALEYPSRRKRISIVEWLFNLVFVYLLIWYRILMTSKPNKPSTLLPKKWL